MGGITLLQEMGGITLLQEMGGITLLQEMGGITLSCNTKGHYCHRMRRGILYVRNVWKNGDSYSQFVLEFGCHVYG